MSERVMTIGEIDLAKAVITSEIKYDQVKILNEKWSVFQAIDRPMSPNGKIYYPPGNRDYCADFSGATVGVDAKATFIHELAHLWQHQHGVNVIVKGAFQRNYDSLPLATSTRFSDLEIEQQAQLIRDCF